MRELELYLHIPFCARKCFYCDFLSGPAGRGEQRRYLEALKREIALFPDKDEYTVSTVFFGGGTPSLLPAEWIAELMEEIRGGFSIEEGAEVTIECNPGTAGREKFAIYRQAGINRISFGLQSADNGELRLLGRIHTWEEFLDTYQAARKEGFENVNVDLMSSLPGQTPASWERTLHQVLALHPEHISAYSLIIEEHTPFYEKYQEDEQRRERGEEPLLLPSEEAERWMYERTDRLLAEAGMHRYEISNYAFPGRECRHNTGYWTGIWYAGFGLGAASLLNHRRYRNPERMEQYLALYHGGNVEIDLQAKMQAKKGAEGKAREESEAVSEEKMQEEGETVSELKMQAKTEPVRECQILTLQDEMEEFMFLGLRLMEGISERDFNARFGTPVEKIYGTVLGRLEEQKLIVRGEGRIRLSNWGIDVSNYVMAEFLF